MAKINKSPISSKKHLARLQRENIQKRYLLIGTAIIVGIVIILLGYGLLDQFYLQKIRPIAVVNKDKISTETWAANVRYQRQNLINSALNTYEYAKLFAEEPSILSYYASQLMQIQSQLDPVSLGQNVLDYLIESTLVKQEATKRGISVTNEEKEAMIQKVFGYFPDGEPTTTPTTMPIPTSTLNPTQIALVSPTPTLTVTTTIENPPAEITETVDQAIEPNLTPTIAPTPTTFTLDAYQKEYQDMIKKFSAEIDFSEAELLMIVERQLLREKLLPVVVAELNVPAEQEMVWARHILVADEDTAKNLLTKLEDGEDWTALTAEVSLDTSSKDRGGDLGWFTKGQMVPEFENIVFTLDIGEVSEPIQTEFGWHIIQVLGHETRKLNPDEYEQAKQQKFQEWITQLRESAKVTIDETWSQDVPSEPVLPDTITEFIQYMLDAQNQQQTSPTSVP